MPSRRLGSRLMLILAGLVAALVLAEITLQIGAAFLRSTQQRSQTGRVAGGLRILCVGDSNTFGLGVEPSDAYPQVLEGLANSAGGPGATVLNFGWPGLNSSRVRADFGRLIEATRPDRVVTLIGSNDFWTVADDASDGSLLGRIGRFARVHSRLFRLYRIATGGDPAGRLIHAGRSGGDPDLTLHQHRQATGEQRLAAVARYGDQEFELDATPEEEVDPATRERAAAALDRNLRAIVREADERDVDLVLLTYASHHRNYGRANPIIRRVARDTGTALVDLTPVFRHACADPVCEELFQRTQHPTAAGYALMASQVWEALPELGSRPAQHRGSAHDQARQQQGDTGR